MLEQEVLRESAVALAIGKPLRTFNARIKKAQEFGLIDQEEADKCQYVRRIRNVAAHRWEMSLTTEDVLSNLKALHEKDHANVLVFHEDLEFLIRHVYSGTCAMLAMTFFQRLS